MHIIYHIGGGTGRAHHQRRRKHKKIEGAPVSRGTFGMKRAPEKFFPEVLATWGLGAAVNIIAII